MSYNPTATTSAKFVAQRGETPEVDYKPKTIGLAEYAKPEAAALAIAITDFKFGESIENAFLVGGSIIAASTLKRNKNLSKTIGLNCIVGPNCLISETAIIKDGVTIGEGVALGSQSFLGRNAVVGAGATIGIRAWVGHGVTVEKGKTIEPGTTVKHFSDK